MLIENKKILQFYWKKYWLILIGLLIFSVFITFFFKYALKNSVTGETKEHVAIVISTSISHGYGSMDQAIYVVLDNGKKITVNNNSQPLKSGNRIVIIERFKRNGSKSIYELKQ